MKSPSRLLISATMRRAVSSSTSGTELATLAAGAGATTCVGLRRDGRGRAFSPKNRRHVFAHTGSIDPGYSHRSRASYGAAQERPVQPPEGSTWNIDRE